MLKLLRAFAKTWVAKILLAVLTVSFGAWGISNVITNLGSNTIARVGGEDITGKDFQRAYERRINEVARQIGKVPTGQEAMSMGIPSQVISQLSVDAAVNQLASQFGMGASDAHLASMLRDDPSFAGTLGTFDRNVFEAVLRQNGYTDAEFFELEKRQARRDQLIEALFRDAAIPETAQQIIARYAGDTRTLDYFIVNETAAGDIPAPTEEDLAAYLKAHQSDFRTEEVRDIDLLSFSPETLAKPEAIDEAAIKAEYEKQKSTLTKIEKRHIEQVVLPDDAAVKTFTDGKAAGTSFDDLVKQTGLNVADLGTLAKSQVTDSNLAEAAFSLPLNGFTIIPGVGGQRAVTVTEIQPGGTKTLAEAHDEIARKLALDKAKAEYTDDLDQIEALRAAFKPLSEIAAQFDLKVDHLALKHDGDALSQVASIDAKGRPQIVDQVFKAEPKALTPMITLTGSHNVWFDLKSVEPARDQTLGEVRDKVAAAWTAEKTGDAIEAKVKTMLADLKAGKSFEDVAAEINQVPQVSQPITRAGDGTTVLNSTVAQAAFEGAEGHFGSATDGDGDVVMFRVERVTPRTDKAPDQTRTFVANSLRNDLFAEFVTGVRNRAGMTINQQALDQLLAVNGQ